VQELPTVQDPVDFVLFLHSFNLATTVRFLPEDVTTSDVALGYFGDGELAMLCN
jgi:hypothetical protein